MAEGEADQRSYVYQQEVEQILGKMNSDISAIREAAEKRWTTWKICWKSISRRSTSF